MLKSASCLSKLTDSFKSGVEISTEIKKKFPKENPKAILVYATMNHNHKILLDGIRSVLGINIPLIGCTSQGIMANGQLQEEGYLAGAIALGGENFSSQVASVSDIHIETT